MEALQLWENTRSSLGKAWVFGRDSDRRRESTLSATIFWLSYMVFHIGFKKRALSRGVQRRFHCPTCGYTMHDILCVKKTISLFFIPVLNGFEEGIQCKSCGRVSIGSQITSSEARSMARSMAVSLRDYLFGNLIPLSFGVFCFILFSFPFLVLGPFGNPKASIMPYTFYDGCTSPETGNLYVVDLHAYKPDQFVQGKYGVAFLKGAQYPRYYNTQTRTFEEKISYRYVISHPVYESEEEALSALEKGDSFAQNYFDDENTPFYPLDVFKAQCETSFKGAHPLGN